MDKLKLAKISIFIMTSFIFFGLLVLGYGITKKLKKVNKVESIRSIKLEKGSEIINITEFNDMIMLHTTLNSVEEIIIANPETGNIVSKLQINKD